MHSKTFSLFFILAISSFSWANRKNYLDELSEDSLIKKECHECKKSWLPFFKKEVEKECEYINDRLAQIDQDEQPNKAPGFISLFFKALWHDWYEEIVAIGPRERMKAAIRVILQNYSDEEKFREYDKLSQLSHEIQKNRLERLKQKKDALENAKSKRKF